MIGLSSVLIFEMVGGRTSSGSLTERSFELVSCNAASMSRVVDGNLRASGAFGNRCPPGGTTNALRMAAASATARSRGVGEAAGRDAAVTGTVVVCVGAQPATAMAAQ